MVPTNRLLFALLGMAPLSIAPLAFEWTWLVLVASWIALGIVLGVEVAVLHATRVELEVARPTATGVGSATALSYEFRIVALRPVRLRLRAIGSAPLLAPPPADLRLSPGANRYSLELEATRRGKGSFDATWLEIRGPLGLVARIEERREGTGPISVVPDLARVDRATVEILGSQLFAGGLKRERLGGEGSELESLQVYAPGMDLRAVDWKASARHQQLRIRRFHVERRQRIAVCIDVGRAMRDPIELLNSHGKRVSLERLDHAVHAALVLSKAALRGGDLVGLHAYGAEPRAWVAPSGGAHQFARLRSACAELKTETVETNHVLGLHDLLRRLHRRALVVVFTEFTDSTTAELMMETLGQLARRHVIVFVAQGDPALEAPLRGMPREPIDLAVATVAAELSHRRELVLARLARLGARVVHAAPDAIAARLIDAYLRIKTRGLIG